MIVELEKPFIKKNGNNWLNTTLFDLCQLHLVNNIRSMFCNAIAESTIDRSILPTELK